MTISPHEPSAQLPVTPSDYDGLGEFQVEDMVTPRLSIVHREGLFKDSLTNQTYQTMNLIILGLVKQRILWPDRMDEGDMPMCRSNDHKNGFVNLTLGTKPPTKQFPWGNSNFDPSQQVLDTDGRLTLPCDSCELKEWGSHPDGKKPWCAELFTLPVMYDPMSTGEYVPALVSFQKTQLKPLRAYLSAFQRMGTPPYQVFTKVGLTVNQFGQNPFSVPNFEMGSQTDPNRWAEYATSYRSMAGFLRTPPRAEEAQQAAQPAPSNNQWGQQAPAQDANPWGGQQAPGQPAWGQQPVQQAPQFQPPQVIPGQVNQQAPVQQAPVQQPVQQAPVQQAPVQQPVQQAPVQQAPIQQPVQQAPVQQAPVQQAPVQQAAPQEPLPVQQEAPAPPPFQQAAPLPVEEPTPAPAEPAQDPAAAPVADPSGIVGGWAAQTAAAPANDPQPQVAAPVAPAEEPAAQAAPVQQAPVQQAPVQQAAPAQPSSGGTALPF